MEIIIKLGKSVLILGVSICLSMLLIPVAILCSGLGIGLIFVGSIAGFIISILSCLLFLYFSYVFFFKHGMKIDSYIVSSVCAAIVGVFGMFLMEIGNFLLLAGKYIMNLIMTLMLSFLLPWQA